MIFKKYKSKGAIFFIIGCLILTVVASEAGYGERVFGSDARSKARHFFLKGNVSEAEGDMAEAYEYYKKALQTDSTYLEAAYNYGLGRLNRTGYSVTGDSIEAERNMRFLKQMADAYPSDADFNETYAFYLVQKGEVPEALKVYERLIGHRPGLSRLYLTRAYLYGMREEMDSAVSSMREFERLEGISSESTLRKASYHLAKGDTVSALQEFRTFAESNPQDIETLMNVSMAYTLLGRQDSAYNIIRDAAHRYPDNMALRFEMALIAKEAGDIDEFFKSSRKALTSSEIDDDAKLAMLDDYFQALPKDSISVKKSDDLMKELAKTMSDDAVFLNKYANYGLMVGEPDLAYENMKKALALNPDDFATVARTITFSALAEKPEEGMAIFENYNGEEKKDVDFGMMYITLAENAKEYDKALAWADTLLQMSLPEASVTEGSLSPEEIGNLGKADKDRLTGLYEATAELYSKMDRKEDAIRCYENALVVEPDNESVKNNYAYYIIEKGKAQPGTPEFERAKQMSYETLLDSKAPYFCYDTYAWILFKERDYKEALKYQEIAIDQAEDEKSAELYDHYGDILFMNGDPEEALKQWEKALEIEPDNELIKKKVDNKTFFYE